MVTPRLMPVKTDAVASVMMKPLMPVRTVKTPLAIRRRRRSAAQADRDANREARIFHHAADDDGDEPAERSDRQD